jgi:hypothetical protein
MGRQGPIGRIPPLLGPARIAWMVLTGVAVVGGWPLPGCAEQAKSIGLELNKLEQQGGNCRAYLVVANPGPAAFSGFTLDLVLFDRGGTIARRLAVDIAPVRPEKTMVKVFDIPETACGAIGSILVNDVLHCRDASGDVAGCVDRITPSSRISVHLSK